ncbi:PQQ-binding-like beta-propeller repeat protein [Streptomyces radiopugnans]|uniref:outer membrane protein assembly factor BamB family protein n=1 Tax=Streptomyces radiopugnans TaxID=403935 RepID=UPI001C431768|nr:PQQ-binding-like beta-propeller repeat protein [Streptomyces radiopugnans]
MTLRELESRFPYGRTQWSAFLKGRKLLPSWLLQDLVIALVPDPRLRQQHLWRGQALLQVAEEAAQARRPLGEAVSSSASSQELQLRLDEARKGQLQAQETLLATTQIIQMLLTMVASLRERCALLETERDRAQAQLRTSTVSEIRQELAASQQRLNQTEERLATARRERQEAEELRIAAQQQAEAYRRAQQTSRQAQEQATSQESGSASSGGGEPASFTVAGLPDLQTYDDLLQATDQQLEAHHSQMSELREQLGLTETTPPEDEKTLIGEVVHTPQRTTRTTPQPAAEPPAHRPLVPRTTPAVRLLPAPRRPGPRRSTVLRAVAVAAALAMAVSTDTVPREPVASASPPGKPPKVNDLEPAPPQKWETNVGGAATLHPVTDEGILLAQLDTEVKALDAASGKVQWSSPVQSHGKAITVVEGTVYLTNDTGVIQARDVATGKKIWQREFVPLLTNTGGPRSLDIKDPLAHIVGHSSESLYVRLSASVFASSMASSGQSLSRVSSASPASLSNICIPGSLCYTLETAVAFNRKNGSDLWELDDYFVTASGGACLISGERPPLASFKEKKWASRVVECSTGKEKVDRRIYAGIGTYPEVHESSVYVHDGTHLRAINAATGQEYWEVAIEEADPSFPVVTPMEGKIHLIGVSGKIYSLDRSTGARHWTSSIGEGVATTPLAHGGTIYVGGGDGKLYALDEETGEVIWSTSVKGGTATAPVLCGDTVCIGGDRKVHSFNAGSGERIWEAGTEGEGVSDLIAEGGAMYVSSEDGAIQAR